MATWLDPDGLNRVYGPDRALPTSAGEFVTLGAMREIELKLTLSTLTDASAIVEDSVVIPAGCRIEEVDILNEVAATGATATLSLGLIRTDRTTAYDADGILVALALAAFDVEGEKVTIRVGSTGAGALLGTLLANPGYLVAEWNTAAFTAGVIKIRIRYSVP